MKETMHTIGLNVQYTTFKGDKTMNNSMEQSKVKIELTLAEFEHLFEVAIFVSKSDEDEKLRLKLLDSLTQDQYKYLIIKKIEE